ncbi:hypothetical protein [Massilia luteola]|uniref:hypothetical protein n=1 Tax=Massilia luteola TaxID=3081751 RepID=UPI002ACC02A4|nr:hypothetical protein [Massilia sp. Gc5]
MMRTLRCVMALCLLAFAGLASATNYTLWINGRTGGGAVGNYADFAYWGPASVDAGVNKKAVNWDGRSSIASQSGRIRDALDCFCTGANWCYIATHSAGDLLIGYTLANYGGSAREKKDARPNASGVCGNAGGASQTGWNIKWIASAAGSGGGSELADIGAWVMSEPLVQDLRVGTARAMYNHNATRGIWFWMYAGADGGVTSVVLPGQDDGVQAYHSAGAVSGSSGGAYCNPHDWFCHELTLGPGPNGGGRAKWANHWVAFRDDGENYNHYTGGHWGGIVAVMRAAVAANAR